MGFTQPKNAKIDKEAERLLEHLKANGKKMTLSQLMKELEPNTYGQFNRTRSRMHRALTKLKVQNKIRRRRNDKGWVLYYMPELDQKVN